MRSPQQLLLLSAALALCAAHTTVVELPATLDPMYTLDREDLRFYASLFDVEQSSSSSSSSIPVGDGGDGTATSERCPWQVVPPRNERVCLVLSEFTPSLYLHNTHDTPAEWNGWHPAMSELPCATRVAAQCARAPTADEAPRHSSATVRDAWSGDSDADDFGRSGRCGFAVAESPVCAHCRNPHLENFDRRCVCVSDDVASGLELDIASSSHSMCIVVAHGVRVMGGVRVATGSGSDVVVVAGALAYDPFSALAFASGVPTADSIDLGDGDDVLLVVAGGSLHSRLVVNAGDGADRVVVRGGGALGTLVPGRGGDRVLLERGALMSGTLNRTAPDAGDTWGDDVYVFNGLVVGELDVSEASAVYVGECALLRGGMRTVDGGDCSTVRLHTLLVASGAAVSGGRPSGGQWHGTDAVFVHTGASLRARIGGALTGTALHSLQHVDAIFYSSASMLNGGRSLCSDFDYGTSQIECAKYHDLIHSESAFRLLVHAGASFHEVALFAGSGVSVAELRDNVRLMSLTVRAPTLHFRAGHALRVTRPENAANFWLSQRVDDADESRIEFGPYAVLGNVTVSGTRVRTVFGERAHALSVYAQTNGAYAADHVSSLLMLQGSAARTVQVNGDYSVLLSGARVGALMQRVSSNNQSQAFLHTLVCSAIVDEATTDGCIGDGRLRVSPSSQLLRRDATYDRFVGVPERRAVCNVRTATVQPQCDRALPACDETCGNVDTSLCALRCTSTSACEWVCPAANCTCVAGRSVEAHCVFPKQCTTDCDDPVCRYDCGAAGALGARDAGDDACDVRSCPQCTPQCSPMRCTAQCDSAALNAECETVFGCANSFYPQTASCVAECEAAQCQWVYADSGVAFESHCPAVLTGRTVVNLERCDDDCTRQLVLVCPTTLDCAARCARDSHGAPYNAGHCARTARCVLDCDHPHCTVSCDAPTCTDYACTPPANCVTSCECRAGACRGSTADKCRTLPLPGDMQLPQFNMVLQPLTKVVVF